MIGLNIHIYFLLLHIVSATMCHPYLSVAVIIPMSELLVSVSLFLSCPSISFPFSQIGTAAKRDETDRLH